MCLRFDLSAATFDLLLSACDKPVVVPPPSAPKPEAQKETADELKKLRDKRPRMDTEKAKFVAVPSTPSDPKPEKPEKIKKRPRSKKPNRPCKPIFHV